MKKNKVDQELIAEQSEVPQMAYKLSPDELNRLTDFVSLLITIDQKNKRKAKGSNSHEE